MEEKQEVSSSEEMRRVKTLEEWQVIGTVNNRHPRQRAVRTHAGRGLVCAPCAATSYIYNGELF